MAEHLRLWIGSKSTTQHNDLKSNFGTFCMEKDLQGDNLDEYSDGLATELKGIGLWGGHHQFKSVMMAYNDYKCADTLVAPRLRHRPIVPEHILARVPGEPQERRLSPPFSQFASFVVSGPLRRQFVVARLPKLQ